MYEPVTGFLCILAGAGLGVIFFGGLWWTLRRGLASPRPALWFLASLVLRTSIVLTGFYFVGREHWQQMVACLLGFIIARFIVLRLTDAPKGKRNTSTKEAGHATES
jgi:F1F0 ATPase subunit 2